MTTVVTRRGQRVFRTLDGIVTRSAQRQRRNFRDAWRSPAHESTDETYLHPLLLLSPSRLQSAAYALIVLRYLRFSTSPTHTTKQPSCGSRSSHQPFLFFGLPLTIFFQPTFVFTSNPALTVFVSSATCSTRIWVSVYPRCNVQIMKSQNTDVRVLGGDRVLSGGRTVSTAPRPSWTSEKRVSLGADGRKNRARPAVSPASAEEARRLLIRGRWSRPRGRAYERVREEIEYHAYTWCAQCTQGR